MATAVATKKIIPAVEEITGVILKLTTDEAEVLKFLLYSCVTGQSNSPRGKCDGIYSALHEAGIKNKRFDTGEHARVHFV